jgi:hypothetical protein
MLRKRIPWGRFISLLFFSVLVFCPCGVHAQESVAKDIQWNVTDLSTPITKTGKTIQLNKKPLTYFTALSSAFPDLHQTTGTTSAVLHRTSPILDIMNSPAAKTTYNATMRVEGVDGPYWLRMNNKMLLTLLVHVQSDDDSLFWDGEGSILLALHINATSTSLVSAVQVQGDKETYVWDPSTNTEDHSKEIVQIGRYQDALLIENAHLDADQDYSFLTLIIPMNNQLTSAASFPIVTQTQNSCETVSEDQSLVYKKNRLLYGDIIFRVRTVRKPIPMQGADTCPSPARKKSKTYSAYLRWDAKTGKFEDLYKDAQMSALDEFNQALF